MEQTKLSQLYSAIHDSLTQSDHTRALRLILANFEGVPDQAPLRERIALILAELGRKKEAVEIYELVGRHYANAGQPVRAIASAKQMMSLKPDTTVLLDHIATLYNIRSPFLDGASRPNRGDADAVDLDGENPQLDLDALVEVAVDRATDKAGMETEPRKLPPLPLLSLLPQEALRTVLEHLAYETFDQSQPILQAEQAQNELFWTASDDLALTADDQTQALPAGTLLGLGGFGRSGRAPQVDVFARPGSEILRLGETEIGTISSEIADFQNRLATLRRHATTERLICRHPLFADLSDSDRVAVIETFIGMRVKKGEVVIEQGTPSPGLFIILDGEVDIEKKDDDWEITIATLKSGDIFGEMGLIADQPAVAGCVVSHDGHLLHLPRSEFGALVDNYPTIKRYTKALAEERANEEVLTADDVAEVE